MTQKVTVGRTTARPLEKALGSIVLGVEDALPDMHRQSDVDAARRLTEKAARERQEEAARRSEYHGLLAEDLRQMASRWDEVKRMREFLAAVAALLAGDAGLRIGEIRGLVWERDVDIAAGTITVQAQIWRGNLGTPKGRTRAGLCP